MGEPYAHKSMEFKAFGVSDPHLAADLNTKFDDLPEPQRRVLETYSGNWMRDFSQVFVPMVIDKCACIKKEINFTQLFAKKPDSTTIGRLGAEELVTALLKVIATIELGEPIGDKVIIPKNLGQYKTEDHMDNPAGLRLKELVVRVGGEYVTASGKDAGLAEARKREIGSSAFKGKLQLEEPKLYEVGESGLACHIYGTIEWIKQTFMKAVTDDPRHNRMLFGTGLHGVEDYFGHANFIEAALNSLRDQTAVDTLFEKCQVPPKEQKKLMRSKCYRGDTVRQPITTGTFGEIDTRISIAHSVLPLIDVYFDHLDKAIDVFLGLIEEDKASTWDKLKELTAKNRAAFALTLLLEGMDRAGIRMPILYVETIELSLPAMLLPKEIEKELQGFEFPVRIETKYVPPTQAVVEYQKYYKVIKAAMPHLKKLKEMVTEAILSMLPDEVRKMIETWKMLQDAYERFRKYLKNKIRMIILMVIQDMLGMDLEDFAAKKHKTLEELAEDTRGLAIHIMEAITHWEAKTALEVRIEKGGDLYSVKKDKRIVPDYEKPRELPPSHSEVCKDHPPKSNRSLFYELQIELAVHADKHLGVLMHDVWSEASPETRIIANASSLLSASDVERLNKEAAMVAEREKKRAEKMQRTFAQNDSSLSPAMVKLLNAVDLYVSHPEESKWWIDVMKNFSHKIEDDISKRNETRSHRMTSAKKEKK
jgi:hypothetical protein